MTVWCPWDEMELMSYELEEHWCPAMDEHEVLK